MRTSLTGVRVDKQVTEVNRKDKKEGGGGGVGDSQDRRRDTQTVCLCLMPPPPLSLTHSSHTCSSLFPNTKKRTEPDKHTDKHQPD